MAAAGLFLNFLLTYIMLTKQLSPQQFFTITILFVVARIIDAVLDPIMGNILDATHSRFGKFKPWIVTGVIGTGIIVIASFANQWQGWTYIIAFAILYLLFNIFFTMNDIAYWGMLPSLTSNSDDRNQLTSLTSLMAGVGAFLTNILVPIGTVGNNALGGSTVTGYAWISIIFVALMFFTQGLTVFGVTEDKTIQAQQATSKRTKVSFRSIIGVLRENDQATWNAVMLFIYMIVSNLSSTVISIYLYFSFGYSGTWNFVFTILGQIAGAVIFATFASISKHFTRKRLIQIATVMAGGGYVLLLLAGLFLPNSLATTKAWLLSVINVLPSVGNGIFYLILIINIANSVEYNEWKVGIRNEGIIFSVRPFVTKLGMAAGQFIAMMIYLVTGILGTTNQISKLESDQARGVISAAAKESGIANLIAQVPLGQDNFLLALVTLIPAIGIGITYWIYSRKIIVDEKFYDHMLADLEVRRQAAAQKVAQQ
ncbi:hypothetical protein FC34_GL000437 [Lacticaseibacillus brantae DSM 23927]|uniref:Uncharacterized protein n=2 Tax=Lacticaseibacillus brantae TaxID=943673 RepID=A0A0R2B034_9LACO|nr:hypothetical protein FC34_GL000437 [Lacticaseibacillus brantae DSM 23927]